MARPLFRTETIDLRFLENSQVMEFIEEQPVRSVTYSPRIAGAIAEEIRNQMNSSARPPQLTRSEQYHALKALRQKEAVEAIIKTGYKIDIAFDEEARFCLESFPGLVTPDSFGSSHVWQGEEDLWKQVKRGVRSFVVDKKYTIDSLKKAAEKFLTGNDRIRITLRVAVASEDQGRNGMPPQRLREMANYVLRTFGEPPEGVAFHIGTGYGLPYAKPGKELQFFQQYGQTIREVAVWCNDLHRRKLLRDNHLVNSEGSFRHSIGEREFLLQDVISSQIQAFQAFDHPVVWKVEPGRAQAPSAVGKFIVNSVGEYPGADGLTGVSLGLSVYGGGHDRQWEPGIFLRMEDVLKGDIFTPLTHPKKFQRNHVYGDSCAGSDEFGKRGGHSFVLMPENIEPGEVLLLPGFGAYLTCLSPQAFQILEGRYQGAENGFNGGSWPVEVACPF